MYVATPVAIFHESGMGAAGAGGWLAQEKGTVEQMCSFEKQPSFAEGRMGQVGGAIPVGF